MVVRGAGPLVDICDDAHAPVEFSCRGATCGTCRVEVLEGEDLLEPAGEHEALLLSELGRGHGGICRLACQAVVAEGARLIRLRWVGMAVDGGQ
jgi:ferredoxin